MAREKNADSAATIERILAAAHVLLDKGVPDELSVRRVAREAGLSVGTVAYYFPSHEALWDACLEAHDERLEALVIQLVASMHGAARPDEIVRAAAREFYAFAYAERAMVRLRLASVLRIGGLSDRKREIRTALVRRAMEALPHEDKTALSLAVQTLVYACARFVCASAEERRATTGCDTDEEAHRSIAKHLGDFAVRLLLTEAGANLPIGDDRAGRAGNVVLPA